MYDSKRPPRSLAIGIIALVLALTLVGPAGQAQELNYVDWSQAGYPGTIPDIDTNVINVREAGVVGDGTTDDAGAIQAIIDDAPNPAVLFFPAGTYRITSRLYLKSGIVLRGEGYKLTHLECQSSNGCISVQGSPTGSFVSVQSGFTKGSTQIVVSDASGFAQGQGGEIQQENIIPPWASWGENAIGQMVKIVAINGNTLSIDPPLHFTYDAGNNPEIRPIRYVEQVGIEDLHLKRLDSGASQGDNVNFRRATNSWIRRVESDWTERYHFAVSESLYIEIRDSYIHDSKSKGDGGQGYGASLALHATSMLVENNIFNELRHSMIIQLGANGCVYGYNYAQRNYSDDGWDKSYISLHGHYPYMNLFESNVVGWAYMGDYWGEIGPGNTLFRNRVIGTDRHQDFGSYRGIALRYFHGPQYIIGNEVQGQDGVYFENPTGDPADVVIHGNNVLGEVTWDPSYPQTLAASYYLPSKPAFYGTLEWPSLGGDKPLGEGSIPALERWETGEYIPAPFAATLALDGTPADRAIRLAWDTNVALPPTSTWQIDYAVPTGTVYLPVTGILSPTRAYTLSGLTNNVWYSVTLSAMLDDSAFLSDTVRVMPFDPAALTQRIYLPVVLR